ncbi:MULTISPECIES: CaiB/BaiF CoA transferase family protein [Thermomonosporaceae]|uniref:CaiB/BaiF CoA transferase family protein n=1 Tax=Thermomonosporaceae TaxID=2012 RepID=UPI00255AAB80|nr:MULTISPECIES: CoA transferase [Thermomonosporaceae]MDL4776520.1 CoA transferase [Actinomadura xylanilytica]
MALEGVRILDFTQMMLGPYGTQLLADLGADVIKVERLDGEWERGLNLQGGLVGGDSAAFLAMNRNKRSVAMDLRSPDVRAALLELAATCDVVVENFRPGVLAKRGLGYDDFRAVKPDIIYCSGSGWGQDTRYAREGRPGQDLLIQAMSGLAANGGRAGDPPTPAGTAVVDAATALTLSNGILAALVARERHGVGQRVEVDLYSTAIALQCQEISSMVNQDREFSRSAEGVGQAWLDAPFGIYRASDGWLAVAMAPLEVVGPLFGAPEVAELDAFADRDEAKRLLELRSAQRTTREWLDTLLPAGVWCARVRDTKEAVDELRADGSDLIVRARHAVAGEIELIGCPIRMSETPWRMRYAPPAIGEHTGEVLGELLPDERIAALRADGVIA